MKDIQDSEMFWAITVVFGYQWQVSADGDPGSEDSPAGNTPKQLGGTLYSVISMESVREYQLNALEQVPPSSTSNPQVQQEFRDLYMNFLYGTIAHEVGHSPGGQDEAGNHAEEGLMKSGGDAITTNFTAKTIDRFRNAGKWSR